MSQSKAQKAAQKAAKAVAAAYRSSVSSNYANAPAVLAAAKKWESADGLRAIDALGGVVMRSPKRRKPTLSAAEKAARKRVLAALKGKAARAARLGGKKRTKKAGKKGSTASKTVAAAARKASKPKAKKVPTVTAESVIKGAAQMALKRWACEGPRRSGCGAGGTRVVPHPKGSPGLVRLRAARLMTAG